MRTCYDPSDIPEAMAAARRYMSWRTWTGHRSGYRLWYEPTRGIQGLLFGDDRIDCERCGQRKRRVALTRAIHGFAEQEEIYLAIVLPNANARAAIGKQIRENKGGLGWFIPIRNAFAVFTSVPMLSKSRTPYSIETSTAGRESEFDRMLDMWWPDTGRMTWPNWPSHLKPGSVEESPPEREPGVLIGFTNAKLGEVLEQADIDFVETGRWINIPAGSFGPDLERALRSANLNSHTDDIDGDMRTTIFGAESNQQEDTG